MEYKLASQTETISNPPLGVQINVKLGRKLSDDEQWQISEACSKISQMLRINNTLADPIFQDSAKAERSLLLGLFPDRIYVREIPSEYHNLTPWFNITTKVGIIKIGWRERVINIDWSDSDVKIKSMDLFPDEDTTRGDQYIHAWGYEKAKEYIDKILANG